MTKQEYIAGQQTMTRVVKKHGRVFTITFFGACVALIPLSIYTDSDKAVPWVSAVCVIGIMILLLLSAGLAQRFLKRQQSLFGIQCRHCSKQILLSHSQIVIATGNCGFCGEKLFDEPV